MRIPILLIILLAALILCGLFFLFEKPLRRQYIRWSNQRFQKRTGIDPTQFPNPFE